MDWRSLFLLLLPRLSENTYSSFQLPVATHFSWRSCSWSCIEYLLWYNHNYGVVSVGYFSSRERLVSPSDRRSQTGTLAQKLDFKLNCKGNEKAQTTWGLRLGISRHCTSGERGDKGSDWEKRNVYWSVCGENLRFLGFGFFFLLASLNSLSPSPCLLLLPSLLPHPVCVCLHTCTPVSVHVGALPWVSFLRFQPPWFLTQRFLSSMSINLSRVGVWQAPEIYLSLPS